jgi:hypothetical protein
MAPRGAEIISASKLEILGDFDGSILLDLSIRRLNSHFSNSLFDAPPSAVSQFLHKHGERRGRNFNSTLELFT